MGGPQGGRALVVVDMTVEQVAGVGPPAARDSLVANVGRLMAADGGFEAVLDSHLWFRSDAQSPVARMYPDVGRAGCPGAELVPELAAAGGERLLFVEKYGYSSFVDSTLDACLRARGVTDLFVCGINTDYCILATALDGFNKGFRVWVVQDACGSLNGAEEHSAGLAQIRKYIGVEHPACRHRPFRTTTPTTCEVLSWT